MRVLIAEDDPGVRSVLERGLAEEGYVCDTASQGDDALHLLRIYDYAALVLDWRMPGRTGEQPPQAGRGRRPAAHHPRLGLPAARGMRIAAGITRVAAMAAGVVVLLYAIVMIPVDYSYFTSQITDADSQVVARIALLAGRG